MTLEEYLKRCHDDGATDHALRATVDDRGAVTFYIHADGRDSDTLDFAVEGNTLVPHLDDSRRCVCGAFLEGRWPALYCYDCNTRRLDEGVERARRGKRNVLTP